ncbi:MAG TPA: RNA ligase, partial [Ktedonobacterales bacterium]
MAEEAAHLWSHQEDGALVLDARLVDRKDFAVDDIGACLFIHPKRDKWDWTEDELRLRSVAVDLQGRVISTGWPKFFNMGERPANDAALEQALESGEEVFFTEKLDGTLIVRSVLPNGKVIFRTRGRWESDEFGPLAHAVASARYPALLDPRIMPEWSLLFEYVGPANLIVV